MYVSPGGNDYIIQVIGDQGRALPLVRTKSGHIMLPISGFQGQQYCQDENSDDAKEHSSSAEWELISSPSPC